jgi:hypothetical protein
MSYTDIGAYPHRVDSVVRNTTGGVLYRGDIVQLEAGQGDTWDAVDVSNIGWGAVAPVVSATEPGPLAMTHGVVLGTAKKFTWQDDEEVPVRLMGVVEALTDGDTVNIDIGDMLFATNGVHHLESLSATEPDFVTGVTLTTTDPSAAYVEAEQDLMFADLGNLVTAVNDLLRAKRCIAIAIDADTDAAPTRDATTGGIAASLNTVFFNGLPKF